MRSNAFRAALAVVAMLGVMAVPAGSANANAGLEGSVDGSANARRPAAGGAAAEDRPQLNRGFPDTGAGY